MEALPTSLKSVKNPFISVSYLYNEHRAGEKTLMAQKKTRKRAMIISGIASKLQPKSGSIFVKI